MYAITGILSRRFCNLHKLTGTTTRPSLLRWGWHSGGCSTLKPAGGGLRKHLGQSSHRPQSEAALHGWPLSAIPYPTKHSSPGESRGSEPPLKLGHRPRQNNVLMRLCNFGVHSETVSFGLLVRTFQVSPKNNVDNLDGISACIW